MAMTTGFVESSMAVRRGVRSGPPPFPAAIDFGEFVDVRAGHEGAPAPMMTMASIAGSALAVTIAEARPRERLD